MVNAVSIFLRMTVLRNMNHFLRDAITQENNWASSQAGWEDQHLNKALPSNNLEREYNVVSENIRYKSMIKAYIESWFSPICCHFGGHPSHFGDKPRWGVRWSSCVDLATQMSKNYGYPKPLVFALVITNVYWILLDDFDVPPIQETFSRSVSPCGCSPWENSCVSLPNPVSKQKL